MLGSLKNISVSRSFSPYFGVNLLRQCHGAASASSAYPCPQINLPPPQFDFSFMLDPDRLEKMRRNIQLRRSGADLDKVGNLYRQFCQTGDPVVEKELIQETSRLPNMCAERVLDMADENKILHQDSFIQPTFKLRKFEDIARILTGARLSNLGHLTGERTYYLTGLLAELEQALVQWTVSRLVKAGFSLVSVPDLLHPEIISACGMAVEGERTQVYLLEPHYGPVALSGTAEMGLGGLLAGKKVAGERRFCA